MAVSGKKAFQPYRTFKIKIVGWLVKKQQVRLCEQHRTKRHPHAPATGKFAARPRLCPAVKTQSGQNGGGAGFGGMGIDIRQSGMDFGNAHGVGGCFGLGPKAVIFDIGGQHRIQQAHIICRRFLFNTANTIIGRIFYAA